MVKPLSGWLVSSIPISSRSGRRFSSPTLCFTGKCSFPFPVPPLHVGYRRNPRGYSCMQTTPYLLLIRAKIRPDTRSRTPQSLSILGIRPTNLLSNHQSVLQSILHFAGIQVTPSGFLGEELVWSSQIKILSVWFSRTLCFTAHFKILNVKAQVTSFILKPSPLALAVPPVITCFTSSILWSAVALSMEPRYSLTLP